MAHQQPPRRPTGTTALAVLLQRLWDHAWDPKTEVFVNTPELKFTKLGTGAHIPTLKAKRGGSGPSTGGDPVWLP